MIAEAKASLDHLDKPTPLDSATDPAKYSDDIYRQQLQDRLDRLEGGRRPPPDPVAAAIEADCRQKINSEIGIGR